MVRLVLMTACIAATAGPSAAQGLRPLAEAVETAAHPYGPARCAGLYQAVMEWVGHDRMGAQAWATADTSRETMILFSAVIAQSIGGGTFEAQLENTVRGVRNIADLYLARMEQNYASSGHAFGEDALIQADLMFCKSAVEALQ